MSSDWTPWRPFNPPVHLTPRVFAELVDGGQAFRWLRQPDDSYLGQWSHHIAALRLAPANDTGLSPCGSGFTPDISAPLSRGVASRRPPPASPTPDAQPHVGGGVLHPDIPASPPAPPFAQLEWRAPVPQAEALATELPRYLGFTPAQNQALDQLPWRSDPHLARCIEAFPGLRILHQPFGETLLGFLCSATKQIVQIKQMLALLAEQHGTPHCNLFSFNPSDGTTVSAQHRLPTWDQLAAIPEDTLRQCQLGFRAKYISSTAKFLSEHPGWLEATQRLPYNEAKKRLLTLPGVGEKIADCVLLFGAAKLEAFPVDTWMIKSMARRYDLNGWSPTQVAHFGRTHFGSAAGLAQQYLFAWERAFGKDHA